MAHPKVSVITPTFNCARYLPEAIDSVLSQTCTDHELIVIDDGSIDNTNQVVATYCDRVRYFCQENRGVATARNVGIREAQGDYVCFLDADDVLLPGKLETQAAFLDQNPNVDIVYSDGLLFRANPNGAEEHLLLSACGLLNKSLGSPPVSLPILAVENAFPLHVAMARLKCVREIGGFDEEKSLMTLEDWDLWFRLGEKYNYAYLDAVLAKYRDWEGSTSKNWHRRKSAFKYMVRKIEVSEGYSSLPAQIKSRVLFSWGVMYLEYSEPRTALDVFKTAIQFDPGNFYARSAYRLTSLMGRRAVVFYHLKRRLFGRHKFPGT